MNITQFEEVVKRHIKPMFTGAELSTITDDPKWKKRTAFLRNQCEMIVRYPQINGQCLLLRRSQPFDPNDAAFTEDFVKHLSRSGNSDMLEDVINPILRRVVSHHVAPQAEDLTAAVLRQFERWAEETYEGRRISAAVGIDLADQRWGSVRMTDLFSEQYGAVLANGLESFLIVGRKGRVIGYRSLPHITDKSDEYSPLRFCSLAAWAKRKKIAIALNRNGEILVFKDGELLFCKRRSAWRHFTNSATITRMRLRKRFGQKVCEAVYRTCLDVSFAKTGGGIALIERKQLPTFNDAGIVKKDDLRGSDSIKGKTLESIVKKNFYKLDRRLRQGIAAMDGATILDYQGNLLAAGAIVKIESGSTGGARQAAARALSRYGMGIKISSDGAIIGFASRGEDVQEVFAVG